MEDLASNSVCLLNANLLAIHKLLDQELDRGIR